MADPEHPDLPGLRRAAMLARGCTDYGGGYRGDQGMLEAYHHGMQTVETVIRRLIASVEAGEGIDMQTQVVESEGVRLRATDSSEVTRG